MKDFEISDNYETPEWLFSFLHKVWQFDTDISCDSYNAKIPGSLLSDRGFNALESSWQQWNSIYCFPPFSKPYFFNFLKKATEQTALHGNMIIMLAPVKVLSADYFKKFRPTRIKIIYPRIHFHFNNRMVDRAESACLLEYGPDNKNEWPLIEYLDLSKIAIRPERPLNR